MVFVNNKKFACESCIKGHRSSSCSHNDRPLFEIKKKGRPISQCEKCRELRQSRRVHSKCNCNPAEEGTSTQTKLKGTNKARQRFIPIVPALPNGIQDAIRPSTSGTSRPPDSRQQVSTLLNPCTCNLRRCKCGAGQKRAPEDCSGLSTLAEAAAALESTPPKSKTPPPKARIITRPNSPSRKRRKHTHPRSTPPPQSPVQLPPITLPEFTGTANVPTFDTIPSISNIMSIEGSGCTCGLSCSCLGCTEHRGEEHADKDHGCCNDGSCRTCEDNRHGLELPPPSGALQNFYALAKRLPEPPKTGLGVSIDPMRVYGSQWDSWATRQSVQLPKLDCCGGNCGCPGGKCGCGKQCDGCCDQHTAQETSSSSIPQSSSVPNEASPVVAPKKSCCSR
ncbi:copper-fist-domain-containing protein [Cylindrobasidium torrendii FP15055 ss-10]|uniref:Copper-fist-domain-containing protein n=1 Tax=Cylindrobasidium torrendii FP15055 ss-10 TaxID=1314674 RepID=A0A0D7BN60_9AGAR|nr:copper-fist-domain-containing protein [Cylindrobasidium torrendii FP15055 ss-10]